MFFVFSCCQDSSTSSTQSDCDQSDCESESPVAEKERDRNMHDGSVEALEDDEAVEASHFVFLADMLYLHMRVFDS